MFNNIIMSSLPMLVKNNERTNEQRNDNEQGKGLYFEDHNNVVTAGELSCCLT